jgi:hypothetical protein
MARRRMIDPSIWDDPDVAKLDHTGRLFFIGCFSNADDEGRLLASPAYLRSIIFKYDDLTLDQMKEIRDKVTQTCENLVLYENGNTQYLAFTKWRDYQSPSHAKSSRIPQPPPGVTLHEILHPEDGEPHETLRPEDGEPHETGRPSLGQSSLGKVSIGKVSQVEEDFSKVNEKDLTDFLTETLEKYRPRGPGWLTEVLCKFWQQSIGERMKQEVFTRTCEAVKTYSSAVLARTYVKTVKYRGGKYGSWKYLDKVLNDQAQNENRSPPK